jgi:hypothetical protein
MSLEIAALVDFVCLPHARGGARARGANVSPEGVTLRALERQPE